MEAPAPLRKSLALVVCDIAGSTRLIAQEGDLVASTVFREFYEHAGRFSREHHCLMIKFIADGFLAAFENIDDVMPFVISLETLLSQYPTFVGRLAGFYFSLHYGDVLYIETSYGSDVLGEAVNVAGYLNGLPQPHEIIVSQAALARMARDVQARAGPSEFSSFKGVGNVEFHRISLVGA
jgi:class 3 adenylate cyclase